MEKIGKIVRFLKIGVCVYFLGAVVFVIAASWLENRAGKVDGAVVEYGQSQLYSKEDMDAAADILGASVFVVGNKSSFSRPDIRP